MSPAADAVIQRLDGTRQKWWFFTFLTTAFLAISASLAVLLAMMLADALLVFSQPVLVGLFAGWGLFTIVLLGLVVRRTIRQQRTIEGTARRIEAEFPELASNLINLVQLSQDTKNSNREFCEIAVNEAAARVQGVPLERAADKETRWRRFRYSMQTPRDLVESLAVLALLIGATIMGHLWLPAMSSAANRLLTPWDFTPSVGHVKIVKVTPENAEVLAGTTLEITVQIQNPEARPYKGTLYVTADDGEKEPQETATPMGADEAIVRYKASIPSVVKSLKYRLEIGDSQTAVYRVKVVEKPTVESVQVTYVFPEYLGRSKEVIAQKTPDLEAPQYTLAELRVRASTTIAKGHLQSKGERFNGEVSGDGTVLTVKIPLLDDATFTIHLVNAGGYSDPDPRLNRIHVLRDMPPTVQFLKPGRQTSAAPGSDVQVSLRSNDDHAVGRVRLEMKVVKPSNEEGQANATEVIPAAAVNEWTKFDGTTTVLLPYRLSLKSNRIEAGHVVMIRAQAWDKRDYANYGLELKPQQASTEWYSIRIVDEEQKVAATLEQIDSVRNALWKLLENQVRTRVKAAMILHKEMLPDRTTLAGEVRREQIDIQKGAVTIVTGIGKTDKEDLLTIKKVVNEMAVGEMTEAVGHCDALAKLATLDGFTKPVPAVMTIQDQIIDKLRKLLDVARKAQSETLAEAKKRPGGDLPNDTKDKLKEMDAKLSEFLKAQKKVIDATTDLAKKPVEDFTEKDEELLKGMAANEDDWSKIMKDFHSDLSKLPDQDVSNSSLAKELVETQTELKMAEDALLKKSADIAVPLEQLGYEKAEEMKADMEKWLPDTPDREKWSQEEALTDADKQSPMAELPSELEDLVGELMEEEEDLMDEMEDVSSSAIDTPSSVGWDASDGPISSNAAKGVTGNRLPNTSEIGGRSGEGRSGKSSGEFVGDEAVGKGGRKTPSRLTHDPYTKGQIKDYSKDPQGGASGGGKESGAGGEGLEGPAPRSPGERDMGRLAGKQAALRNKAEAIDIQMQVANYHHTDLKKMIDLMASVERDLRAGRYQNALRQRNVMLESAKNVKQYLEGEFQVKQDATANLPKDIQKDILGSMQDPSPVGWEEINRDYFERLSTGGAAAMEAPAPSDGKEGKKE